MAVHGNPDIVTDGLILALDAADKNSYPGSGTTWFDSKGSGINGTISGCTFSEEYGGILNFDGSNDKVDFSPSAFTTVDEITISMWCRVESNAGSYRCFMSSRNAETVNDYTTGFNLDMTNGTSSDFRQFNIEGAGRIGGAQDQMNFTIPFNTWTHINVTKSTSVIKSKINLEPLTDRNRSDVAIGLQYICIGARYYSSANRGYFDGDISNVQLYDRVLTDSEIVKNYNATKSRFGL